jgi:anthranilate phosphoribosyltransferase
VAHRLIEETIQGKILRAGEAEELMEELLAGRVGTPQTVQLLAALNARPCGAEELAGFARVMRRYAAQVFAPGELLPERMVDTCGTGGDDSGTFNISTAAAIVAAAAGARVAKHGNRAASSKSGSADVLEALGVRIDLPLAETGKAIREIGIGFLFAQTAHTAMRHVMPARKQIRIRTVFNLLGPLTNPAGARAQVLGVFSPQVLELVAETLLELGTERAFVVHGAGKLDEISLAGPTLVAEVSEGRVHRYEVAPEDFEIEPAPPDKIRGGSPAENAEMIHAIFSGEPGPPRDIVVINSAAALVAAGVADNFREGARLSQDAINTGAAKRKLAELAGFQAKD